MLRRVALVVGIGLMLAVYYSYAATFLVAFMHPSKSVVVTVNDYNEALPEFIVTVLLGVPLATYTALRTIKGAFSARWAV